MPPKPLTNAHRARIEAEETHAAIRAYMAKAVSEEVAEKAEHDVVSMPKLRSTVRFASERGAFFLFLRAGANPVWWQRQPGQLPGCHSSDSLFSGARRVLSPSPSPSPDSRRTRVRVACGCVQVLNSSRSPTSMAFWWEAGLSLRTEWKLRLPGDYLCQAHL